MEGLVTLCAPVIGFLGKAIVLLGVVCLGIGVWEGVGSRRFIVGIGLAAAGAVVTGFAAIYGG